MSSEKPNFLGELSGPKSEMPVSPEEQEVINSGNTAEALALKLFLSLQEIQERENSTKSLEMDEIQASREESENAFREVVDPDAYLNGKVDAEKATQLAQTIRSVRARQQSLSASLESSVQTVQVNYPLLRKAVVFAFQQTGGTPLPTALVETPEQEESIVEEIQAEKHLPPESVEVQPQQKLLQFVEGILSQTLSADDTHLPFREAEEEVVFYPGKEKGEEHFKSWADVFSEEDSEEKPLSSDPNFTQKYRFAIAAVVKAHPDLFQDYGDLGDKETKFNWLGAIVPLYFLSVDQLNKAVNTKNSLTEITTARVLALVKRVAEGKYTHHDELVDLAKRVRTGEFDTECCLGELFDDKAKEETAPDIPESPDVTPVTEVGKDEGVPPTTTIYDARRKEQEDNGGAINLIIGALNAMQKTVSERGANLNLLDPELSLNVGQVTRAFGGTFSKTYMQKLIKCGLIAASGPQSKGRDTFTLEDLTLAWILNQAEIESKTPQAKSLREKFERSYEKGLTRFKAKAHEK